jgi:hypothetical protein
VEADGSSVWTPRDTPEPGLRIEFVAAPGGNLVELLSPTAKLLRPLDVVLDRPLDDP